MSVSPPVGSFHCQYVLENGSSTEIAVVGNEGVVSVSIFMGGNTNPSRAVVQSVGMSYRLRADANRREVNIAGPVMHLTLRYTRAMLTQMCQTPPEHMGGLKASIRCVAASRSRLQFTRCINGP